MVNFPCSKHSENLINRKIGTFYIEMMLPKILNSDKKNSSSINIFFRSFSGILGFSKGFLIKPL